ncbi:MAG: extracellular solute-binding protein [Calditrichae bacterium]|nr:extracellular solute-binding protein [Calditrichia bacterium]
MAKTGFGFRWLESDGFPLLNKKREAVEFIKFVLREESQRLLFEQGGYIPISKSVYQDSVYFSEHQDLKYYHQLLKMAFIARFWSTTQKFLTCCPIIFNAQSKMKLALRKHCGWPRAILILKPCG